MKNDKLKRYLGEGLLGEVGPTDAGLDGTSLENPTFEKIPQMISSFTTGLARLDYFLKRSKNLQQYQFAFQLGNELLKTANTVQKVSLVWKTFAEAYGTRFVKE